MGDDKQLTQKKSAPVPIVKLLCFEKLEWNKARTTVWLYDHRWEMCYSSEFQAKVAKDTQRFQESECDPIRPDDNPQEKTIPKDYEVLLQLGHEVSILLRIPIGATAGREFSIGNRFFAS